MRHYEDWYKLRANWKTRDVFFRSKLYEIVDPLIPAKPVSVRRHVHTPFFFRVRTRPTTAAGTYRGTITVHADNAKPTPLSLEVKVWPYAIPEKWNFHTMGQLPMGRLRRMRVACAGMHTLHALRLIPSSFGAVFVSVRVVSCPFVAQLGLVPRSVRVWFPFVFVRGSERSTMPSSTSATRRTSGTRCTAAPTSPTPTCPASWS